MWPMEGGINTNCGIIGSFRDDRSYTGWLSIFLDERLIFPGIQFVMRTWIRIYGDDVVVHMLLRRQLIIDVTYLNISHTYKFKIKNSFRDFLLEE